MKLTALLFATILAAGQTRDVRVISHRGEHLHHTENTLGAYQAAIDVGADYFEVDVRTTADGQLLLMHDATLDRTTNGKGSVRGATFAEIRKLDAGGGRVPSFEESLVLARGRCGVYADVKQASAADVVKALEKQNMQEGVVVYAGFDYLKELQALRPQIRVMPESVSVLAVRRIVEELKPKVIAFSARDWVDDIIRVARDAGADIFVDRLGEADNIALWQDAIERGATGIQTDHPGELVQYLRSRGLHK